MKFCQPIKPLELFTDEELTDAFCCGGQHQFAIEIFERWNKARAELAKAREAGQVMFENSSYLVFMDTPQATEMHHALCKGRGMWAALATKAPELGGGAA